MLLKSEMPKLVDDSKSIWTGETMKSTSMAGRLLADHNQSALQTAIVKGIDPWSSIDLLKGEDAVFDCGTKGHKEHHVKTEKRLDKIEKEEAKESAHKSIDAALDDIQKACVGAKKMKAQLETEPEGVQLDKMTKFKKKTYKPDQKVKKSIDQALDELEKSFMLLSIGEDSSFTPATPHEVGADAQNQQSIHASTSLPADADVVRYLSEVERVNLPGSMIHNPPFPQNRYVGP